MKRLKRWICKRIGHKMREMIHSDPRVEKAMICQRCKQYAELKMKEGAISAAQAVYLASFFKKTQLQQDPHAN